MATLVSLNEELKSIVTQGAELDAKAREEDRVLTGEERAEAERLLDRARELKADIDAAQQGQDLLAKLQGIGPSDPPKAVVASSGLSGGSIGQRFVNDEGFKAWHAQYAGNDGIIPESRKGIQSPPIHLGGLKDLILAGGRADSVGAVVVPERTSGIDPLWREPMVVSALVDRRSTSSDTIEYVIQKARTNNAKMVEEAASTGDGADGALTLIKGKKPISGFTLERQTAIVKTGATLIPVTRRAIADAQQLRGLIDAELRGNLSDLLETQIVKGDGAGENFTGILTTSGIQVVNKATIGTTETERHNQIWVGVRKARRLVRSVGHTIPTAVLINPEDAEAVDLARSKNGEFLGAGPAQFATPPLWGLPRVESEHVEAGTMLVGDFKFATLWDREMTTVYTSDSHADWFAHNLLAMLGEFRAAFAVRRPAAFVKVTLDA